MSSKHREQNVLLTLILLLPFGSYLASASVDPNSKCPDVFGAQCYCGVQPYGHNVPFNNNTGRPTFVTNCTNVNFTDVTILSHVPQETEVLIFTGNNFPVLPANVLDQSKKYDKLFLVDLSNNQINHIHGKTFHNMKSVQILILNKNNISITGEDLHLRMFGTLKNLEELHLNGAFNNGSVQLVDSLKQIFVRSQLTSLKVLSLEHNHIQTLNDFRFFCSLPELQQISLAFNYLTRYELNVSCLKLLHKIDVSHNQIETIDNHSILLINTGPPNYHFNINSNPFNCNCSLLDFFRFVRNVTSGMGMINITTHLEFNELYLCYTSTRIEIIGKYFDDLNVADFDCQDANIGQQMHNVRKTEALNRYRYYITLSYLVLIFLISLLFFLIGVLFYTNREFIHTTWNFFLVEISAKRDYTALDKEQGTSVLPPDQETHSGTTIWNNRNNRRNQTPRAHIRNADVAEVQV